VFFFFSKMKRSFDEVSEAASSESGAAHLPGSPLVPSLVSWSILGDPVSPELAAVLGPKIFDVASFQEAGLLSRRNKPDLRSAEIGWLVSPVIDGERFLLFLDSTVEGGVFALSETGKIFSVLESAVLLGFILERNLTQALFEVVFAFSPKSEEFVMVVQDALSLAGSHLSARRLEVGQFAQFCATRAKDLLPFEVMDQRFESLTSLPKLISSIMWHEETSSRVLVHGDFRIAVLGLRFNQMTGVYLSGGINSAVLDWFFPRQHVLFARLFALAATQGVTFGFRDAEAGVLSLNPAHVEATLQKLADCGGSCICKLMFDPTKGFYHVRALYAPAQRRLTTASCAFAAAMQANEAVSKEELMSWMPGAEKAVAQPPQKK
jgi:hypothetical protein